MSDNSQMVTQIVYSHIHTQSMEHVRATEGLVTLFQTDSEWLRLIHHESAFGSIHLSK